jgi:heat shock protein HtpX
MFTDGDDSLISRDLFPESHPPTGERVEYLQELAARQEGN